MAREATSGQRVFITAYPTRRAVFAMALGLPVSLGPALIVPALWAVGVLWLSAVIGLMALDWWLASRGSRLEPEISTPRTLEVGERTSFPLRWPALKQDLPIDHALSLTPTPELLVEGQRVASSNEALSHQFDLYARRRGDARLDRLWQRWTGPFRLIWVQRVDNLDHPISIITDTRRLTEDALALFNRHAEFGRTLQRLRGEGTEFDALTDYVQGMDPRTIDWKHSARHGELLAREYETEKNNHIVFAIDSGYLMTEESEDEDGRSLTKLDRCISAAMLMAFVSIRLGDRAGLFAFDAKPYLFAAPTSGPSAFAQLQAEAARIDYSETETNFTLGLTTLSQRLKRRTLVVVFSDFIDTTQAELMIENVSRLLKRHVVIFVTLRDAGLRTLTDDVPDSPAALARAVVADSLRQEREIVLAKLERLGVTVINTDADKLNASLINSYIALKAANVL